MSTIVGSSNDLIGTVILSDSTCMLYGKAFQVTGIMDTLQDHYVDDTYGWANDKDRIDSCTWTNTKLCIPTAKTPSCVSQLLSTWMALAVSTTTWLIL